MHFRDYAFILSKKPLKEKSSIIWLFTQDHGLYCAVIRESVKNSYAYQPGNLVDFFWQARLHEHIGTAKCELIKSYSSVLVANKTVLYAFNSIVSLMRIAFHEREPHNRLFPLLTQYLEQLIINFTLKDYINFELEILSESGHTLGLKVCGVTGTNENLYYVSPKSGNAITQHIGNPYADKLLRLPSFMSNQNQSTISKLEQKQAFDLTEYFFNRYLLQNRTMPLARNMFVAHILDA